jgi:Tol biopolymer transport system component
VITPNGRTDLPLIRPEGGAEIGSNSDPSWSPDSRSLLVHVGGGDLPNGISMARRDDDGNWSVSKIVAGPLQNYLPAWSNDGSRFTFLREIAGSPDFVAMVADADGSNVRQLSDRALNLTTTCWTPDDRYIRAEASGANRTIVLIPLDTSQAEIDIPALGGASAGCSPQRRAP